jgi:hypothetical protein
MNNLLRPRIWPSFSPSCRLYEPEAWRPQVSAPAAYHSGTETNPMRLPGGTTIFMVSRQQFMKYPGYSDFNFRIQVNLIIHYIKNAIFSGPE